MALRHYDFGKLSFVNIVGYYCSLVVGLILRLCFVYCLGCFCCLLVLMRGFCGLLVFVVVRYAFAFRLRYLVCQFRVLLRTGFVGLVDGCLLKMLLGMFGCGFGGWFRLFGFCCYCF